MAWKRREKERERAEKLRAELPEQFWDAEDAVIARVRHGQECPEFALFRVWEGYERVAA